MVLREIPLSVADRLLYPTIAVLVTSKYKEKIGGMMAAWWTQLSIKPLLIGVAIAPERYTYKLIKKSRIFAINILDYKYVEKTPYLGDASERFFRNKIARAGFHVVPGRSTGAPIVEEASAALELKLRDIIRTGDHDLFVGEVVAAYAVDDFSNGMWRLVEYNPLLYLGRTRRPQEVKRVYIAGKSWEKREVKYAPPPLDKAATDRIRLRNEVKEIVKQSKNTQEAIEKTKEILRKMNLEEEDAEYLVDDIIRSL